MKTVKFRAARFWRKTLRSHIRRALAGNEFSIGTIATFCLAAVFWRIYTILIVLQPLPNPTRDGPPFSRYAMLLIFRPWWPTPEEHVRLAMYPLGQHFLLLTGMALLYGLLSVPRRSIQGVPAGFFDKATWGLGMILLLALFLILLRTACLHGAIR